MPQILRLSQKTKNELINLIKEYHSQQTDKEKDTIITKTFYLLGQRTKKSTIKTFLEIHKHTIPKQ
jgi:hypothetical protein